LARLLSIPDLCESPKSIVHEGLELQTFNRAQGFKVVCALQDEGGEFSVSREGDPSRRRLPHRFVERRSPCLRRVVANLDGEIDQGRKHSDRANKIPKGTNRFPVHDDLSVTPSNEISGRPPLAASLRKQRR